MYFDKSLIGGIILGLLIAVALFFAIIGIAAAVNDITFGEQIVEWFGSTPVVEEGIVDGADEVVEQITENATA